MNFEKYNFGRGIGNLGEKSFGGLYYMFNFPCRIEYEKRLMLLEIAQVPAERVNEFKSVSKFRQV